MLVLAVAAVRMQSLAVAGGALLALLVVPASIALDLKRDDWRRREFIRHNILTLQRIANALEMRPPGAAEGTPANRGFAPRDEAEHALEALGGKGWARAERGVFLVFRGSEPTRDLELWIGIARYAEGQSPVPGEQVGRGRLESFSMLQRGWWRVCVERES